MLLTLALATTACPTAPGFKSAVPHLGFTTAALTPPVFRPATGFVRTVSMPAAPRHAFVSATQPVMGNAARPARGLVMSVTDTADAAETDIAQIRKLLYSNYNQVMDMFLELDANGDGCVSEDEFQDGMQRFGKLLGIHVSSSEVDALYAELDTDGDGYIDPVELGQFVELRQLLYQSYAQVVDLFLDMTQGQSESEITPKAFKDGIQKLQDKVNTERKISEHGAQMLFDAVDADRSGAVNFEELQAFMAEAEEEKEELDPTQLPVPDGWWKGYVAWPLGTFTLTGVLYSRVQQFTQEFFAMKDVNAEVLLAYLQSYDTVLGLLYAIILGSTYQNLQQRHDQLFEAIIAEISEVRTLVKELSMTPISNCRLPRLLALCDQYLRFIGLKSQSSSSTFLVMRRDRETLDLIMEEIASLRVASTFDINRRVDKIRNCRVQRLAKSRVELPPVHWIGIRAPAILIALSFLLVPPEAYLINLNGLLWGLLCAMLVAMDLIVTDLADFYTGAYDVSESVDEMVSVVSRDIVRAIQADVAKPRTATRDQIQSREEGQAFSSWLRMKEQQEQLEGYHNHPRFVQFLDEQSGLGQMISSDNSTDSVMYE